MADWNIEVDSEENRLYITLSGRFSGEEAEQSTAETLDAIEEMDEGFEVITDLRELEAGGDEALEHLARGKEAVKSSGAVAAVRVTGGASATGKMQFDRVGEEEEEYAVAEADTVEQAEKLLDKRRQQA